MHFVCQDQVRGQARYLFILQQRQLLIRHEADVFQLIAAGFQPVLHLCFIDIRGRRQPKDLTAFVVFRVPEPDKALPCPRRMDDTSLVLLFQHDANRVIRLLIVREQFYTQKQGKSEFLQQIEPSNEHYTIEL